MKKITQKVLLFLLFMGCAIQLNAQCNSSISNAITDNCNTDFSIYNYISTTSNANSNANAAGDKYYMHSLNVGHPWFGQGGNTNPDAMDAALGSGNWTQEFFESADPNQVFSSDTNFVFLDGSDAGTDELIDFLTPNSVIIEDWVQNGGSIIINAAPNEGDAILNIGFDSTTLINFSFIDDVEVVDTSHPIFLGPNQPTSALMNATSYAHATVVGEGYTNLISDVNDSQSIILAEKSFGSGHIIVGGMTTVNFHNPSLESVNWRVNMLVYAEDLGQVGSVIIDCPDNIVVSNEAGECGAVVTFDDATAMSDMGEVLVVEQTGGPMSGAFFPVGSTGIQFSATDPLTGDTANCQFTVTVEDVEVPVIDCVGDSDITNIIVNGSFESGDFTGWTAIDNPNPFIPFSVATFFNGSGFFGNATPTDGDFLAGNGFDGGIGEAILFQDLEIPSGVSNTVLSWDENIDFDLQTFCNGCQDRLYEVQIRDTDDTILEVVQQIMAVGGTIDSDNLWESFTVDVSAYIGQTIRIAFWQNIPDVSSGPAKFALDNVKLITSNSTEPDPALVFQLDETGNTATIDAMTFVDSVTDNCDVLVTVEGGETISFDCSDIGESFIEVVATDVSGNSTSCLVLVSVVDSIIPLITCPANQTVNAIAGQFTYEIEDFSSLATITDNCESSVTIVQTPAIGTIVNVGDLVEITLTGTDAGGNVNSCQFEILVEEGDECVLAETTSFTGEYQIEQLSPSIFDFETFTEGSGMMFTLFSEQTDGSQQESGLPLAVNQRSFDATYLLEVGIGQAPQTFIIEFDDCGVTFSDVEVTGLQCTGTIFLGPADGGLFDSSNDNEFILTFIDDVENSCGEGSPMVELRFFKGATLNCPDDIILIADSGTCEAVVNFDPPVATDIDGTTIIAEQTAGPASGSSFPVGVTTVQFSVTSNVTGVVTNCSFDIFVTEDVPPTIECPVNDITLGTGGNNTATISDFADFAVVNDNCTPVEELIITQDPVEGTEVNTGETIEITLTVQDSSGNEASCTFNVIYDPTLSLDNVFSNNSITIYPNPTQGDFIINNASLIPLTEVTVFDINGRIVETVRTGFEFSETSMSIQNLASGVYFIKISSDAGTIVKRIVKE